MSETVVLLFSYGTLQQEDVQIATFHRRLTGVADALPGFRLGVLTISDPDVVGVSGAAEHLVAIPSREDADEVPGVVFEITPEELRAADVYESADYTRVLVRLKSGTQAWLYVAR
jgi:hypothetical protein